MHGRARSTPRLPLLPAAATSSTATVSGKSRAAQVAGTVGLSRAGAIDLHEHSEHVALGLRTAEDAGSRFWLPHRLGRREPRKAAKIIEDFS